jgi:hypothetical protein
VPVNASEEYLSALAQPSFLDLWTIPNPFKKAGKELTDLLVVFGNDVVAMSDKASEFDSASPHGWTRWHRRTIEESTGQLKTAVGAFQNPRTLYLDAAATVPFPFTLPAPADQQYHLLTVARPSHDPQTTPEGWSHLTFDTDAAGIPFTVGPEYARGRFVHVFDGHAVNFLLSQLDTAPDFLDYLRSREKAIRAAKSLRFKEQDLFTTAVSAWRGGSRFTVTLPPPAPDGRVVIPEQLWENYVNSDGPTLTSKQYRASKTFDNLINHFHEEYAADRMLSLPKPSYDSHEAAMRIMASESRFSRRMIIDAFMSIYDEVDTKTFWASTVPSPDSPDVRYVWLTYPQIPEGAALELYEAYISMHLRKHTLVARLAFGAATYVGIALPNKGAKAFSRFIRVLDGFNWSDDNQEEAEHWKADGIFANLEPFHRLYTR